MKKTLLVLSFFLAMVFNGCNNNQQNQHENQQTDQNTDTNQDDNTADAFSDSNSDDSNSDEPPIVIPDNYLTFVNWNLLVSDQEVESKIIFEGSTLQYASNYKTWGGLEVAPRMANLVKGLQSLDKKPDFIVTMEMDPIWKSTENLHTFAELGYKAIYPNTPFMLTQMLYRTDRFTLIEKGYINYSARYKYRIGGSMKSAATFAVFQEKESNEIFIPISTHWDPNNDTNLDNGIKEALINVYRCEKVREVQARETSVLIKELLQKYPTAHIMYGGDFNTVDFDLLPPLAETILGFQLNVESILAFAGINDPDFTGGYNIMLNDSGLVSSRRQAISDDLALNDNGTIAAQIKEDINPLEFIIDYSFYSPELILQSYQVLANEPFKSVSDHRPVAIKLGYKYSHNEALTPLTYPDDSGTDLYLPEARYQGDYTAEMFQF